MWIPKKLLAITKVNTLVCPAEEYKLTLIEDLVGSKIKRVRVKGFDVTESPPLNQRKVKAAPAPKKAISRADAPAKVRRGGSKTVNEPAKKIYAPKAKAAPRVNNSIKPRTPK